MHILGDKVKSMRSVASTVRLSVILVMGWCSILAGDIGVERQPPEEERDFFSLLVGGGVDKSPHFLTVTDSRPLEPSLFFSLSLSPTYMNDRTRISPVEIYISVAATFFVRPHLFELFYIPRFFIINISCGQTGKIPSQHTAINSIFWISSSQLTYTNITRRYLC